MRRGRLATRRAPRSSVRAAPCSILPVWTSGVVNVTSPSAGRVLRVPQESEAVIATGTPIVEVGDPQHVEVDRGVPVAGCRADEARRAGADRELGRAAAAGSRRSRRARRAHEDLGARRRRATHERDPAVQGRAARSAAGTRLPRRRARRRSRGEECDPRAARRVVPPRRRLGALQGGRRSGRS